MRNLSVKAAAVAVLVLSLGLVATNAGAAYSGTIVRTVCPGGALVPILADRAFWDTGGCDSTVTDPGSSTYRVGVFSIPIERQSSSTPITASWTADGGGPGVKNICVVMYVFDSTGNFSAATSGTGNCTVGPLFATSQSFSMPSVTLPVGGAVYFDVAAQDGATLGIAAASWTANGT